jgi:hypothetical protein
MSKMERGSAGFFLSIVPYSNIPFRKQQMALLAVLSLAGYFATLRLIPVVAVFCRDKGDLFGRDINKVISDKMYSSFRHCEGFVMNGFSPESLGIVVGVVYLTVVIMFQPFFLEKVIGHCFLRTPFLMMTIAGRL